MQRGDLWTRAVYRENVDMVAAAAGLLVAAVHVATGRSFVVATTCIHHIATGALPAILDSSFGLVQVVAEMCAQFPCHLEPVRRGRFDGQSHWTWTPRAAWPTTLGLVAHYITRLDFAGGWRHRLFLEFVGPEPQVCGVAENKVRSSR